LYAHEASRWTDRLYWDTASSWDEVERGRLAGRVPGVIARDEAGIVRGWSFYLVHNRALQIGGFVAESEAVSDALVDAILEDADPVTVDTVSFFAFTEASYLAPLLRRKGLSVDRYFYMVRELPGPVPATVNEARRWLRGDLQATAELLGRSYESPDPARPFAPRGTPAEWIDYVTQLTTGPGCGTLLPDACLALPAGPGRLAGVAITTRISSATAHLAQIAVDPAMQRRRLGVGLLETAVSVAARSGCSRLTLLVGGRNRAARRMYEEARFAYGPSFLAGGTFQPRRSTSVAPGARATTLR
jgi:GNAT superfamily N-acetyltransferase